MAKAVGPTPGKRLREDASRTVAFGDSNGHVEDLKHKLRGVCAADITEDGFGHNTLAAVYAFQAYFQLRVDGIVGDATWELLDYCAALKGVE